MSREEIRFLIPCLDFGVGNLEHHCSHQGEVMSPKYEFRCPRCSAQIEQTRGFDEDAPAPICGDCCQSMERVWSAAPVHFKGSGFYTTDKGQR